MLYTDGVILECDLQKQVWWTSDVYCCYWL